MNTISAALGRPIQSTQQLKTTAPGSPSDNQQAGVSRGDTVTISNEARKMAKGADDNDVDGSTTAVNAVASQGANKKVLTQNLQDAKIKQKSMKAQLEAEKLQEQANPGSTNDILRLSAKLDDINNTVSKDQARVYS